MPYRKASTTNPLETEMRQARENIETLQLEIEATIGELKETLYALRELSNPESDLGARWSEWTGNEARSPTKRNFTSLGSVRQWVGFPEGAGSYTSPKAYDS